MALLAALRAANSATFRAPVRAAPFGRERKPDNDGRASAPQARETAKERPDTPDDGNRGKAAPHSDGAHRPRRARPIRPKRARRAFLRANFERPKRTDTPTAQPNQGNLRRHRTDTDLEQTGTKNGTKREGERNGENENPFGTTPDQPPAAEGPEGGKDFRLRMKSFPPSGPLTVSAKPPSCGTR